MTARQQLRSCGWEESPDGTKQGIRRKPERVTAGGLIEKSIRHSARINSKREQQRRVPPQGGGETGNPTRRNFRLSRYYHALGRLEVRRHPA